MIYFLWKASQQDLSFTFVPESELPKTGFRSLYGVSKADADAMLALGSYAGYQGVVYPTEKLWIDCDDPTGEAVKRVRMALDAFGLEYEVWASGNGEKRHIAVTRKLEPSQHVPETDKAWVTKLFDKTTADPKIYSHLHLFRCEGSFNEKRGGFKRLLEKKQGIALNLAYSTKVKTLNHHNSYCSVFEVPLILELSVPHFSGMGRREHISRLAIELVKTGNPYDFCLTWVKNVNMLGDSLDDLDIERIVDWAFKARGAA